MEASKENCQHALDNLKTQEQFMNGYEADVIKAFLEAALKRLPSQAAIEKDRGRKKQAKPRTQVAK